MIAIGILGGKSNNHRVIVTSTSAKRSIITHSCTLLRYIKTYKNTKKIKRWKFYLQSRLYVTLFALLEDVDIHFSIYKDSVKRLRVNI